MSIPYHLYILHCYFRHPVIGLFRLEKSLQTNLSDSELYKNLGQWYFIQTQIQSANKTSEGSGPQSGPRKMIPLIDTLPPGSNTLRGSNALYKTEIHERRRLGISDVNA